MEREIRWLRVTNPVREQLPNGFCAEASTDVRNRRINIVSERPLTTNGIIEIKYQVLKNDGSGGFISNGKHFYKTTFNPNIVSESQIKSYGYNAFRYALDNNTFNINTRLFNGVVNGKNVEGYYETVNGINIIKTWYLKE